MNERFQPLRIRAYLQTGIISDQFLPLDGIIYAQYVREKFGERDFSLPSENNIPEGQNIQLPIRKAMMKSDAWFYKCSFAQWPVGTIEDQQTYSKRFDLSRSDLADFGKKKEHVDNQRGFYKSYHVKIYYRHAKYVEWYADADKNEMKRILKFCTHLGKKTSQGWGSVLRWEITDWPEDWSVRGEGNKLMRAVPMQDNGLLYGVRPSYWLPKHQFSCKMP